nr:MAG TPA: hypothetical protein [Caudoviricetes sp.]
MQFETQSHQRMRTPVQANQEHCPERVRPPHLRHSCTIRFLWHHSGLECW